MVHLDNKTTKQQNNKTTKQQTTNKTTKQQNNQKNMKINEGFELREVCGEHVIVAHGVKNIDFSKIINLNESAVLMWKSVIGKDFSVEDLQKVLLDTYDVDEHTAAEDAKRVCKEWKEIGLID